MNLEHLSLSAIFLLKKTFSCSDCFGGILTLESRSEGWAGERATVKPGAKIHDGFEECIYKGG